MTELRVFFLDQIAYAPSADGKEMWALLPSTSFSEAHVPYLIYETSSYEAGEQGQTGNFASSWQLAREEINFDGNGTHVNLGNPVDQNEALPSSSDTRFGWVTRARDLIPTGTIKTSVFNQNAGNLLSARVKMTHGKLEAFNFCTVESDGKPGSEALVYAYFFARNGTRAPGPSRAMVNITVWRVKLPDNTVTIHGKDFNGHTTRMLKLKTQASTLDVVVGNLGNIPRTSPNKMAHFSNHYSLVQGWNAATQDYLPFRDFNFQPKTALAVHGNRPFPPILKYAIDPKQNGDIRIDKEACPHLQE